VETKLFEIRDECTCISALATRVSGEDGWLVRRAGFRDLCIILTNLINDETHSNPYDWSNQRTMPTAYNWLEEHWDETHSGQVIDVRYILGETSAPVESDLPTYEVL
jgi:hypothetical protein